MIKKALQVLEIYISNLKSSANLSAVRDALKLKKRMIRIIQNLLITNCNVNTLWIELGPKKWTRKCSFFNI